MTTPTGSTTRVALGYLFRCGHPGCGFTASQGRKNRAEEVGREHLDQAHGVYIPAPFRLPRRRS